MGLLHRFGLHIAVIVTLTAGVLAFAVPAFAQDLEVMLDPEETRPEGTVTISVVCDASRATADISSFGGGASPNLPMDPGPGGTFEIGATAPPRPGSYAVDVECGDGRVGRGWLGVSTEADLGATGNGRTSGTADTADSERAAATGKADDGGSPMTGLGALAVGGILFLLYRRRRARSQ